MFNNDTQLYTDFNDLCHTAAWYVDDEGLLYVIPTDNNIDSVAPDNIILDALHNDMREYGKVRGETLENFELNLIPEGLRRFNGVDGYYYA